MSRFKKFLIMLAGCLVVSGTTAFALTATDFYQEASSWSYQNCRSVSETNRLNNTVCFLLKNQSDNQIKWALQNNNNTAQQQSIGALKNQAKKIKVFDNDGRYLGLAQTPYQPNKTDEEFFDTELQKIVIVRMRDAEAGLVGWAIQVRFTAENCSGDAYMNVDGNNFLLNTLNDRLLVEVDSHNFWTYYDNPTIETGTQLKSVRNGTQCINEDYAGSNIKLRNVTPSYPYRVSMPLDYRYE